MQLDTDCTPDGSFSVKSNTNLLAKELFVDEAVEVSGVLLDIRDNPAPSKVTVFSRQLLHDRISTKNNLARRRILQPVVSMDYMICRRQLEASIHLFLHCEFSYNYL
ncbi:F-box family protein, partial [Trifolium pratense]